MDSTCILAYDIEGLRLRLMARVWRRRRVRVRVRIRALTDQPQPPHHEEQYQASTYQQRARCL